jgi:ABC-type cobalamin/Fe3+-siderophores transport system ATPase subunit
MSFNLQIPRPDGSPLAVTLELGQWLFLLGANGTGKSSLMQQINNGQPTANRIAAHRQTWFTTNALSFTANQRRDYESSIQSTDRQWDARWKDDYAQARANVAVYDLIEAENVRARKIAGAVDNDDIELARKLAKHDAPIKVINEVLHLSNLPITISVKENEQVFASKEGGPDYSITELSDGERNALLIAATVLTVKTGTLLLIDEPERHLHRSIISPLLTALFTKRPDCAFIISTHEVLLPVDNPKARTLLVRGCTYSGRNNVTAWDADLLSSGAQVDEALLRDILGSRRKIIFIEGTESSLDKPLYSIIFPGVSIVAKASFRDVRDAVTGIREARDLHWVHPFGIVDNDRRASKEVEELKARGIYALSVFSVESIYYHPDIQQWVTRRQAEVIGDDAKFRVASARDAAIDAVEKHVERLAQRVAERAIRESVMAQLPTKKEIAAGNPISLAVDIKKGVGEEVARLKDYLQKKDLPSIVALYPVRETPALAAIAAKLGFQNRDQYESAVRKLLIDQKPALDFVRTLFGTLPTDLAA